MMVKWKVRSFGPYSQSEKIEDWLDEIQQIGNIISVELHPCGSHGEIVATTKIDVVDNVEKKGGDSA